MVGYVERCGKLNDRIDPTCAARSTSSADNIGRKLTEAILYNIESVITLEARIDRDETPWRCPTVPLTVAVTRARFSCFLGFGRFNLTTLNGRIKFLQKGCGFLLQTSYTQAGRSKVAFASQAFLFS